MIDIEGGAVAKNNIRPEIATGALRSVVIAYYAYSSAIQSIERFC